MVGRSCSSLREQTSPRGLFRARYNLRLARTGFPSRLTWSCARSTLAPSSWIIRPFTLTLPSRMSCSPERREATPASARNFWSRSFKPRVKTQARSGYPGRHGQDGFHSALDRYSGALGFAFCLAQTGNPVALFPLPALFQKLDSLKSLEHISFAAQSGGGAQTPML